MSDMTVPPDGGNQPRQDGIFKGTKDLPNGPSCSLEIRFNTSDGWLDGDTGSPPVNECLAALAQRAGISLKITKIETPGDNPNSKVNAVFYALIDALEHAPNKREDATFRIHLPGENNWIHFEMSATERQTRFSNPASGRLVWNGLEPSEFLSAFSESLLFSHNIGLTPSISFQVLEDVERKDLANYECFKGLGDIIGHFWNPNPRYYPSLQK